VPDGTPKKKLPREIELSSLARAYTTGMVAKLGNYALNEELEVDDELRLRAIGMLLDRGWGKPNQPAEHKVDGELRVTIRKMLKDLDDA
jgi:hypothetical protein